MQNKIGDYITIVSDNTGGDVAYPATFNFNPNSGQHEEDVYYVRVSPSGVPTPTPTRRYTYTHSDGDAYCYTHSYSYTDTTPANPNAADHTDPERSSDSAASPNAVWPSSLPAN